MADSWVIEVHSVILDHLSYADCAQGQCIGQYVRGPVVDAADDVGSHPSRIPY